MEPKDDVTPPPAAADAAQTDASQDVAPDTVQAEPPETPETPVTAETPDDVDSTEASGDKKTDITKLKLDKNSQAPAVSKKRGSGVTAAIIATVIIVLGLAAMAVYAYLQTV